MKKYFLIGFIAAALPIVAFADNGCSGQILDIGKCVNQVYIWALGAGAILALIYSVFGGFMVLTAAGNADRAVKGRNFLLTSIIGLILLFGAYLLLHEINPDLTNFTNPGTTSSGTAGQPRQ